mmetsp:Transcript_1918/g.2481  ORF Transcript_1918/g.2481 Transcript_1918/m.2481 type:complete len:90 (+) Transcript_1918:107-376(+)
MVRPRTNPTRLTRGIQSGIFVSLRQFGSTFEIRSSALVDVGGIRCVFLLQRMDKHLLFSRWIDVDDFAASTDARRDNSNDLDIFILRYR